MRMTARDAVPAIYSWRDFPDASGLISYGSSFPALYRRGGIYADSCSCAAKSAGRMASNIAIGALSRTIRCRAAFRPKPETVGLLAVEFGVEIGEYHGVVRVSR